MRLLRKLLNWLNAPMRDDDWFYLVFELILGLLLIYLLT